MNILCNTKEELKKVLENLEKGGYKWHSSDHCVEWGMTHLNDNFPVVISAEKFILWDLDVDNYEDSVKAAQFLADADLNTEKEGEPMPEILVDKAEYDKAVLETLEELGKSEELNGPAQFLVPLVGAVFSKRVKERLFKEDKHNGSK